MPIFEHFNYQVQVGEAWAVLGPSGCGKSTLLYLLAGLQQPNGGQICVGGACVSRPRPETGLILQDYGLLPWATVRENVLLGLRLRAFYGPDGKHAPRGIPAVVNENLADNWIERLGLTPAAGQYPGQLSGGQRQRTAIARTLTLKPDLLLMDEPFASLDALTREALQKLVIQLQAESHLTSVIVTHSLEEAAFLGQKILVLKKPPNTQAVVVENPRAGSSDYLNSPAYSKMCDQLRSLLEESL